MKVKTPGSKHFKKLVAIYTPCKTAYEVYRHKVSEKKFHEDLIYLADALLGLHEGEQTYDENDQIN